MQTFFALGYGLPAVVYVPYRCPYCQLHMCSPLASAAVPSGMLRRSLLWPQEWLHPSPTGTIWGAPADHLWASVACYICWLSFQGPQFCSQHQMPVFQLGHWMKESHLSVTDRIRLVASTESECFAQTIQFIQCVCRQKEISKCYEWICYHIKYTVAHMQTSISFYKNHMVCRGIEIRCCLG